MIGLYSILVGDPIPTSSQELASNQAPDPPKMGKILQNQAKINIIIQKNHTL
jgi:hypothetical protein